MIKLSQKHALLLHKLLIEETGGAPNVRDSGLLDSALESAYATFGGADLYPTMEKKAAQTGFSLIANHAFFDGNKRIGMFVMLTFLEVNGIKMSCGNDDVVDIAMRTAQGKANGDDILAWIEKHRMGTGD